MSQLIQLRRHIKSIKTTKKITYAMRLISMSLYSKLEKYNKPLRYYQDTIFELLGFVLPHVPDWENPIIFPKDILNTRPLFIIIASSKGLCGSFNAALYRHINRYLHLEEHQVPAFITIGTKAHKFVKDQNLGKIIETYNDFTSNNFLLISHAIATHISDTSTPYSSVTFFSSHLKSFFIQTPKKVSLIPMDPNKIKEEINSNASRTPIAQSDSFEDLIWEQSPYKTLNYLAHIYLKASIEHILFQSLIAEQASRFLAMDSATSNADKFLEKLTLEYNKSRQALITREVSELAASLG